MADFYALGELLIDFTPAGKTPAGIPIFEQNPGGAPANVAVQAARLGVSAGFIGVVPEDDALPVSLNQGTPLLLRSYNGAASAYRNIAIRLQGGKAPLLRIR